MGHEVQIRGCAHCAEFVQGFDPGWIHSSEDEITRATFNQQHHLQWISSYKETERSLNQSSLYVTVKSSSRSKKHKILTKSTILLKKSHL